MLYNLTDALWKEGKVENLKLSYEPDVVRGCYHEYPVLEKSDLLLVLENCGKGEARIKGSMSIACEVPCDRCLKPVRVLLELHPEETVKVSDIEDPSGTDEITFMKGYELDINKLIGNEILMNWPTKVLCRDDCKGICRLCGKDLNLGDCGCDTFVPDPRMAVIKDIFNA